MKRALLFILTAALSAAVAAQGGLDFSGATPRPVRNPHEFSVQGGGGLSTLSYRLAAGSREGRMGGELGLGYAYHLSPHWGVATGLGVSFHHAAAAVNGVEVVSSGLRNRNGYLLDLHATLRGHSEAQSATFLNIPLQARLSEGRFYALAGVSLAIPLAASYRTAPFTVTTRGYYPDYQSWGAPEDEALGYGAYAGAGSSGAVALRTSVALALEAGCAVRLNERWRLDAGLYFDYGLSSAGGPAAGLLVPYRPQQPAAYAAGSVLASTSGGQRLAEGVAPLALGVKVRLALAPAVPSGAAALAAAPEDPAAAAEAEKRRAAEEERLRSLAEERQRRIEELEQQVLERVAAKQQQRVEQRQQRAEAEQQRKAEAQRKAAVQRIEKPINGYLMGGTDISQLSAAAIAVLNEKFDLLKLYPNKKIIVEGHTCNLGSHEENVSVGLLRAEMVKSYLVQKGIDPRRITTVSKAEAEPLVPNTSEANRKQNRRVNIRLAK
jgi:outer membrane protein OmpA-like peptidoglycan-associated protein